MNCLYCSKKCVRALIFLSTKAVESSYCPNCIGKPNFIINSAHMIIDFNFSINNEEYAIEYHPDDNYMTLYQYFLPPKKPQALTHLRKKISSPEEAQNLFNKLLNIKAFM